MKRLIYQVYVGKRSHLYDHCVESVSISVLVAAFFGADAVKGKSTTPKK